jgi:hypothetical protein
MRYFTAWAIPFGSTFMILEIIKLTFGDEVHFGGPMQGVVAFIAIVPVMVVVEELVMRFYRRLARYQATKGPDTFITVAGKYLP